MKNQQGGILSKLIMIPAGVVIMAGLFFLGYYMGSSRNRTGVPEEITPPLPELASGISHTSKVFTFYKTLTDKNNKTISIDIRPTSPPTESKPDPKQVAQESEKRDPVQSAKANGIDRSGAHEASSSGTGGHASASQAQRPANQGQPAASRNLKLRYTLQTASHREQGMAVEEVKDLKRKGYAAFVSSSELPGKGTWHRVRLGSFTSREAAEKLRKTLKTKERISSIIVIE